MLTLLEAVGLVLALEGAIYAVAPALVKRMMFQATQMPDETLRIGGVVALGAGVLLLVLVRG